MPEAQPLLPYPLGVNRASERGVGSMGEWSNPVTWPCLQDPFLRVWGGCRLALHGVGQTAHCCQLGDPRRLSAVQSLFHPRGQDGPLLQVSVWR